MLDNDFTQHINSQGYHVWPWRQDIFQWSQSLLMPARQAMAAPEHQHWWRHQNTWFVGVNALTNNSHGQVTKGKAMPSWLQDLLEIYCLHAPLNLDKGQISTCRMGYPQQDQDEPDQTYYFRKHFYAAHMDGLIPEGNQRRRYLKEYHSFILGVPLTEHDAQAAPLMVWPNSHQRLQTWLLNEFANIPVAQWGNVDITDAYQQQRRAILMDTKPVPVPAQPGQVYLLHRHMLHGIGTWLQDAQTPVMKERTIVYFRPDMHTPKQWLHAP